MMNKFRMPPGFRFNPSDQELLLYLKMKAMGVSFPPWKNVVLEKNLYSQNAAPWELFNDDDPWQVTTKVDAATRKINVERVVYVVTKLVKIGDKKTVRSVGSWTWDGSTGQKNVWNNKGQVVGFKKTLNLRAKGMDILGNWIMYEYHLSGVSLQEIEDNEYVICRLKWDYSRNIKGSSEVQESDGFEKLGKKRARFDQEIPVGKRVCSRGTNSNVVINKGNLMAKKLLISKTEGQESEAHCGKTDECESLFTESSRFDQESGAHCGKSDECTRGIKSTLVINEGSMMGESSLISETVVPENSFELKSFSMDKSRFDQESSIGTGVSGGSSSSINCPGAYIVDLDSSHGEIANTGGEIDIMQQVQEDNFCFDLGDIIEADDLTSFEGLF